MNRILFLFLFSGLFVNSGFSQEVFNFDLFRARIENSRLTVTDNGGNVVLEMSFSNPHDYTVDLDGDSVNEYIVIDSTGTPNLPSFTIYIFNTIDNFNLADSIVSGVTEPYDMFSNEEGGEIIVTGNEDFESFNGSSSDIFLPVNCWKYDSGQVYLVNDDIYDLFIQEDDEIIDYLDSFYESGEYNCGTTSQVKSAIAAAYANYINAGEVTIASQFLKKYYPCDDTDAFLKSINELLNKEKNE